MKNTGLAILLEFRDFRGFNSGIAA